MGESQPVASPTPHAPDVRAAAPSLLLYYRVRPLPHRDDAATRASSFSSSGDGNLPESREGTGREDIAARAVPSGMRHAATPWWRRR